MKINPSIFRSYDIRGIYPSEFDEKSAFAIGKAFVKHTKAKSVVVGQDARLSGPTLFDALASGILSEGAKVYDIGQVPTECLYFAVGGHDFPAGIMITASHNPKEYNGFKMIQKIGNNIEMVRGLELAEIVKEESSPIELIKDENLVAKEDIWKDYLNYILSFIDLSEISPLKIVVDASNGVAGHIFSKIQDKLPIEIVPLNFEPNGNFPNHSPNPLIGGAPEQIASIVKREKADFGIMFDGDADRIFLMDENGKLVPADITLILLAKYLLKKNPGSSMAYNLICSKAVPKFVEGEGGKAIRTQVGFVNVRDGLLKNNGVIGGEVSGHYCFRDYYFMDSGMIAFLTLLSIFSKDQRSVSEIVKEVSVYAKTDYNFEVKDKAFVSDQVKQKYGDAPQDFFDGITVEYENWWFNLRPSNTEPFLRLTIEADTQEILEEKLKELKDFIIKISGK